MAGNAILRHPTLTILQQIEELKTWHKQQQSKLDEIEPTEPTRHQRRNRIENSREKISKQNEIEVSKPTDYVNFDELPIKTASPNLCNIIENNVIPNDTQVEDDPNNEKPKFRFLKKGEGIARFRMGPPKKPKYKTAQSNSLKLSSNGTKSNFEQKKFSQEKCNPIIGDNESSEKIATLQPPDLKLDIKNSWKSIFDSGKAEEMMEKAIDSNLLGMFQPNSTIDSSTASLIEKFMLVGEFVKEKEEQRIFNLMEQHVLDSSFSSTSTYVENMMKNAIISTPIKRQAFQNTNHSTKFCPKERPLSDSENGQYAVKLVDEGINDKPVLNNPFNNVDGHSRVIEKESDLNQSVHVRFSEQVDYKSFIEISQSLDNSAPKETPNSLKETDDDNDEWKEDNSDCCSQCDCGSGSSDNDHSKKIPPKSSTNLPPQNKQSFHLIGSKNDHSSETLEFDPTGRQSDIELNSKENIQLEPNKMEPCNCPTVLIEKKEELEREIKIFQVENSKLRQMQEEVERERKQFQRDKRKFLKDMEEEKKKNALQLDEEKKKLAKEKSVFERYSKSLQRNPTREERKEIQALQDQLSEMKQELSKKESRWGSAQARVRNQVKHLEDDNKKLKDEIEVLRKQAKHLELMTNRRKSKPFNNTKLIHDINNQLSNIVVEDDTQEVGYFKPNASVKTVTIEEVDPKTVTSVRVIKETSPKSTTLVPTDDHSTNKVVSTEENRVVTDSSRLNPTSSIQETVRQDVNKTTQGSQFESAKGKDNDSLNTSNEVMTEDGNQILTYRDGRKEIRYKNGNIKKIDLYSGSEKMIYFNGDVREVTKDGTVKYFYFESRTWQTTLPDGLEIFDFPNQQVEKRYKNGMVESIYPDGKKQITFPNGSAEIHYPDDGRVLKIEPELKRQVLLLPNGQKEIRTDDYVRREYPDGTIRTVHPDGTIETVYSNGRVRLKDKHGNLVMDSGSLADFR